VCCLNKWKKCSLLPGILERSSFLSFGKLIFVLECSVENFILGVAETVFLLCGNAAHVYEKCLFVCFPSRIWQMFSIETVNLWPNIPFIKFKGWKFAKNSLSLQWKFPLFSQKKKKKAKNHGKKNHFNELPPSPNNVKCFIPSEWTISVD